MELRPYQQEAVERISHRHRLLLGMVMGSGKTCSSIVAIRALRRRRVVDSGVIFAPGSVKWQWEREIRKWDPRAAVQVVDGDKKARIAAFRRAHRYHYTIATYDTLIHDWDVISQHLPIDFIIADEVTALKGFRAKRTRRAKALAKHSPVRLGLSGKPVENRPEELFSIMEFVDADVLGSFHKFDRTFIVRDGYGRPVRYRNLHMIEQKLGEAMFRKSRADIAEWLPERIEMEMPVKLDRTTMALHDLIRHDLSVAIDKALAEGARSRFDVLSHYGRTPQNRDASLMGDVMSRLLAMRMLSSHPGLLRISASEFDSPVSKRGSKYAAELVAAGVLDSLPPVHDKFSALLEQVENILDEDPRYKVVTFSYFLPMISMIGTALAKAKIPFTTLTGAVPAKERDRRIQRFNNDPNCRVFLSSDAGAYGVDLHEGSHLLHYDLPWSGGALDQRTSRIDRTNSAFESIEILYVYGRATIEERMFRMLQQKDRVARAFLDGEYDGKTGGISLDLESLREFLDAA